MNEFSMRRNWGPVPNYPLVINYKRPSDEFIRIAGPCSIESLDQIHEIAAHVSLHGATHLRGGVFRAGTYPGKSFGWINDRLIHGFKRAANVHRLLNIIEVLDYSEESFKFIEDYADCYQVGARSQQNYSLLKKVGASGKPVFIKRNVGSTIDELLGSAEHVLTAQVEAGVKQEVYLIERGSATQATHVRWDLSISMIPAIKQITDIPVIVDASHGTGRRDLVSSMTLAGVAAGAGGCLIEVHPDPEKSISDADQAINYEEYQLLMEKIYKIREVLK